MIHRLHTWAAGDALPDGDFIESRESIVRLRDGRGTLVALGLRTRATLTADALFS
ncbi:hypothetical protein [Paraburkholderia franconis]|uniref:hypothetical protein n=1 Tax=Paraburkholderia franconis TaxID=2654983 RepID=UPI00187B4E1B|nr:hypothetical protein [Paraburkholderia franconis]